MILNSFFEISGQLAFCDNLLIRHQASMMRKEYDKALMQFEQLYEIRISHLKIMEEKLLPLYESVVSGIPQGGRPAYFIREKKLILKELNRHARFLGELVLNPAKAKPDLVILFEEYAWLKDLLDHHDAREKAFLFPVLEREISSENKKNYFLNGIIYI